MPNPRGSRGSVMPASISSNDETSARTCKTGADDLLVVIVQRREIHDHAQKIIFVLASSYVSAADPDIRYRSPQTGDFEIALGQGCDFQRLLTSAVSVIRRLAIGAGAQLGRLTMSDADRLRRSRSRRKPNQTRLTNSPINADTTGTYAPGSPGLYPNHISGFTP